MEGTQGKGQYWYKRWEISGMSTRAKQGVGWGENHNPLPTTSTTDTNRTIVEAGG